MISISENKAVICKGDFHPAAFFKGDKKIAGYIMEEFQGTGSVMLESCYNDKVYDAQISENSQSITVRGKNYFDLDKVPFSNGTTQPYNNGLKATKLAASNRGDRIPISLPADKTIYMTLDIVDSQIDGTAKRVTLDFLDSGYSRVFIWNITSTIAHKSYSYTPTKEIKYVQFYFQASDTSNADGDYVTMDNIMFRTEGEDVFEPYVIPQTIHFENGEATEDIPTFKGTTVLEIGSAEIRGKYKKEEG